MSLQQTQRSAFVVESSYSTSVLFSSNLGPRSKCELFRKVVLKRKLDTVIIGVESIEEVFTPTPLKLATNHHVFVRVVEQVAERIMTSTKGIGILTIRVIDSQAGVSDCTTKLL